MQNVIKKIVSEHLQIKRGERIYLAGNSYALNFLDLLLQEMLSKKAKVTSSFWTDTQLIALLRNNSPKDVAKVWIPKITANGTIDTFLHEQLAVDKIVTHLSMPLGLSQDLLSKTNINVTNKDVVKLNKLKMSGMSNLLDLMHSPIKLGLLDYPSVSSVEKYNYNHESIVKEYNKAIMADGEKIRSINKKAYAFFKDRQKVQITCPRGTNIEFEIGNYKWNFENMNLKNNSMVQIPGGESYVSPNEKSGNGVLVTYLSIPAMSNTHSRHVEQ
jgi:leucyl aminopeptidase (aminopeptidase T)